MVDMSDTPAGMISRLDDAVRRRGQTVTLTRTVPNAPAIEKDVRAFVRGYEPGDLPSGVTVGTRKVVISPTALRGTPFDAERDWLRPGDKVLISGRLANVDAADNRVINDLLVRVNLQVTG